MMNDSTEIPDAAIGTDQDDILIQILAIWQNLTEKQKNKKIIEITLLLHREEVSKRPVSGVVSNYEAD